ncbi:cyclin-dependent kinase 2-associated protein 1-like isoform X1 [Anguilla anguilla]|uniref:cyclin-dependent kinase 2-associated protein 1-like isoform X1 n=1 Tax=Anguilla anguilla TaxID=7936 RepID=UPI0015B1B93B|nr:cyclin-dependent kinase 2-associated protein 1-like isoform X1 [Anguilla anguilla]
MIFFCVFPFDVGGVFGFNFCGGQDFLFTYGLKRNSSEELLGVLLTQLPETGEVILPTEVTNVGNVHSPSTSLATLQSYRPIVNDYGPPSLGFTQGTSATQVPQSKYAELLAIIEELGKEIRPTYAGSKSAMERLKRGIIHARGLVRECLAETERNARS